MGRSLINFKDLGSKGKNYLGLFSGIWGDQCTIFREQESTDPLGGLMKEISMYDNLSE